MTVINTNVAASITANALTAKNERAMSQAMERALSTGQRINNAGDDAARSLRISKSNDFRRSMD